jgi:hypothetical protein
MAEQFWAVRHVTGDDTAFVAVANPIGCNKIRVENNNAPGGFAVRLSSDTGIAQAYVLIEGGDFREIELVDSAGNGRMPAGAVVVNLKTNVAGAFDASVHFLV